MLEFYILCSIVGGIFVFLSVLGGLDFDLDADFDAEADFDADADAEVNDVDFGTYAGQEEKKSNLRRKRKKKLWLPFFSFKFWTFGVCFFGLTGLALTLLEPDLGERLISLIALGVGLASGTAIAWFLRVLSANQTNSLTQTEDYVGLVGKVEIPFDSNTRGKVQLSLNGSMISHPAMTEDDTEFQQGDEVLVVSYHDNKIWVVSADTLKTDY